MPIKAPHHKRPNSTKQTKALLQILPLGNTHLTFRVALPWDIVVSFEDCDTADAFYAPKTRQLTVCYQLIDEYYDLFGRKIKDKAKLDEVVSAAL